MPDKFNRFKALIHHKKHFILYSNPSEIDFNLWFDDGDSKTIIEWTFNSFDSKKVYNLDANQQLNFSTNELTSILFSDNKKDSLKQNLNQDDYENLIQKTVDKIKHSDLEKIVISRKIELEADNIHLLKTLVALREKYANAYVYLWHHPLEGFWFGASPELLLEAKENTIKSMALAGTKKPEADWTHKEILEQQYVTEYIKNNLSNCKNLEINGPVTITNGIFEHLKTDITADISDFKEIDFILKKLHPTPAVCGLPKEESMDFIIRSETYERAFYAGFIGFKTENKANYFVNLRCAKYHNGLLEIFVGGGITSESNPISEWHETELKSQTIISVLKYK